MSRVGTEGRAGSLGGSGATAVPPTDGGATGGATRTRSDRVSAWVDDRPVWLRWLAVLGLMLVLSTVLVARVAYEREELSRADEYVFVDAVDKATRGEIVREGAQVDDYALGLLACRGVELFDPMGDRCGGPYDRSTFPYRGAGITTADIHSPVYFFLTAGLARAVQALTPADELLNAARLTGALWLGLGLTTMIWLARTLGAARLAAGAVALLVLASPQVRWTNGYITPDALNLLWGSLLALGAVQYARGRWSPWVLIAVSAAASAVKAQNSIGSALAAVFLVLLAVTVHEGRTWRRFWRHLGVGAGAVVAALAVQLTYNALRSLWSLADPPPIESSVRLTHRAVLGQVKAFMLGVTAGPDSTFVPALAETPTSPYAAVISWVVAAGVIGGGLFVVGLRPLQLRFAQATLLSVLAAGPLFYLLMYVLRGSAFSLPDRYGMVMLPAMAAVLALVASRRWVQASLLGLGVIGYYEAVTRVLLA